jgi:hypothetical protein
MSGKTKRKYETEIQRFNKSIKKPLDIIKSVLPYNYTYSDILSLFKELYPYEWDIIIKRYEYFSSKDKHLQSVKKKRRYKPTEPNLYLKELPKVKHILSEGQKKLHKDNFKKENRIEKLKELQINTKKRMERIDNKIKKSTYRLQEVEPLYLDIFIEAYHQKTATLDDKMEIVKELQKYECEKSTIFFQKLNDSERNKQIQTIAHEHLKSLKKYVKLRKNFKGKKKDYMSEKTIFDMKPLDLLKRIEQDSVQNKKSFNYFVSHSYKDNKKVQDIVKYLNTQKLHTYCDWFNDTDFLKRTYVSAYTEIVLKKRIEQSTKVLFIKTNNTNDKENKFYSQWVEMEIGYAKELDKNIECINLTNYTMNEFNPFQYDENQLILKD